MYDPNNQGAGMPQQMQQMQQAGGQGGMGFIQELDMRLKSMGAEKVMKLDMLLSQANPELLTLLAEAVPEAAQAMQVMMQMKNNGGAPQMAGGAPTSGLMG